MLELTTKNKAYLKGLANRLKPSLNLGKDGVDDKFIEGASKALEAHELIKLRILPNASEDAHEIAREISHRLDACLVDVIGRVAILYRPSAKKPKIVL